MRKTLCVCLLVCMAYFASASDSLLVNFNTKILKKGDTLEFSCSIPDYAAYELKSATLNVWIEDVQRHNRWKYRYPIINGEVTASLKVSKKIADGRYAVNFLVQRGFFKIYGQVLDHTKRDDSTISCMMVSKNKQGSYIDFVHVERNGNFHLKSTLFADSAFFIFSPTKKPKNNYLTINIETPLDSAFVPVISKTSFITIGDPKMLLPKKTDTSKYVFTTNELQDPDMLPNVTVTGKYKTKVQQYDEEYSRGLFQSNDAIIFDGIGSDEIGRSATILQFLQGRVAGLTIEKNSEGLDVAKWRNTIAEIYLDEFRLQPSDHTFISPTEVAMIKVYRPPAYLSSFNGGAGAIAIYTKRGIYATNNNSRHNFIVKGYTKIDSSWE